MTKYHRLEPGWRHQGLVHWATQHVATKLGFAIHTVEVSNLSVGDLPYEGRGEFFLSVQCNGKPPMTTSVCEGKQGRIVHFPEVLTLRFRARDTETIRFAVQAFSPLLGITELCNVRLDAANVLAWSRDPELNFKRFAMMATPEVSTAAVPWICMEFDPPMHDDHHQNLSVLDDATIRIVSRDGSMNERSVAQLKHEYALLDGHGTLANDDRQLEPDRGVTKDFVCDGAFSVVSSGCFKIGFTSALLAYALFRFYTVSCFREYQNLALALAAASDTQKQGPVDCQAELPHVPRACLPEADIVEATCRHLPSPKPRVNALSLPCHTAFCGYGDHWKLSDILVAVSSVFLLGILCARHRSVQTNLYTKDAASYEQLHSVVDSIDFSEDRPPRVCGCA